MHRIGVRLLAGLLSLTLTLGMLTGVASLAGFESSRELQVVVLPAVTVTANRSELIADACSEDSVRKNAAQNCVTRER
jgi:hypothetical protein